jgi:hypothetical protein
MCLQNYVADDQLFNLVFAGAEVRSVFDEPVRPTPANLAAAYGAIIEERPDPDASTMAALETALPQAAEGVVILISDLYQPYDYYTYDDVNRYQMTASGDAYEAYIDSIGDVVLASNVAFFTIADEWQLNDIAYQSGGYNLASLRYDYYYAYDMVGGARGAIAQLPGLFLDNWYNGGITNVSVSSNDLDSITFTTDGYGYSWWWWGGPVMMDGGVVMAKQRALGKSSEMVLPYNYGASSTMLRVAGMPSPARSNPSVTVTIEGKMGGLAFTKVVTGSMLPAVPGTDNVQWAFRKSEQLANDNWQENGDAIKAIGLDYHIVTRQTSLLALEPGMELWPDTVAPDAGGDAAFGAEGVAASDAMMVRNGTGDLDLDDASLEDLIAQNAPVVNRIAGLSAQVVSARVAGRQITVNLAPVKEKAVVLRLFDLNGRQVWSKILAAGRTEYVIDIATSGITLSRGSYVLRVVAGGKEHSFKISIVY